MLPTLTRLTTTTTTTTNGGDGGEKFYKKFLLKTAFRQHPHHARTHLLFFLPSFLPFSFSLVIVHLIELSLLLFQAGYADSRSRDSRNRTDGGRDNGNESGQNPALELLSSAAAACPTPSRRSGT